MTAALATALPAAGWEPVAIAGGDLLRLSAGALTAAAVGAAALAAEGSRPRLGDLSLALATGLALTAPALLLVTALGAPTGAPAVLGVAAVLTLALAGIAVRRWPPAAAARAPEIRLSYRLLAALPAAAALGVFVWKLARVPLWSWDHYALWGLKARRLYPGGVLDLAALTAAGEPSRPDYPFGLPLVWRVLTLGAEPAAADFLLAHALFAVCLVALVTRAARRLSGSHLVGAAAAALTAASPLLWDTESLGLADLPLATFAVAALAALPIGSAGAATRTVRQGAPAATRAEAATQPEVAERGRRDGGETDAGREPNPGGEPDAAGDDRLVAGRLTDRATVGRLAVAGVCLGFLPWIKTEGLPLALLIAAAAWVLLAGAGWRRRAALLAPAAVLTAAALALVPAGARGAGFFRGDWLHRGGERLARLPELLALLAGELSAPDWLGLWWLAAAVLAAAAAVTALRRRRTGGASSATTGAGLGPALALAAVVLLQLALYSATYLVSYIPLERHVDTSFFRVASALAPLALLAAAAALPVLDRPERSADSARAVDP